MLFSWIYWETLPLIPEEKTSILLYTIRQGRTCFLIMLEFKAIGNKLKNNWDIQEETIAKGKKLSRGTILD